MKRIIPLVLAVILVLTLTACQDKTDKLEPQQVLDSAIEQMSKSAGYKYTLNISAVEYAEPVQTEAPVFEDAEALVDDQSPGASDLAPEEPVASGQTVEPDPSESFELLPSESVTPEPSPTPSPSPSPSPSGSPSPTPSVALGASYGLANQSLVVSNPLLTRSTSVMTLPDGTTTEGEAVFSQEGTDYYMYIQPEGQWLRLKLSGDRVVNEYFKFYFVNCLAYFKDYIKDLTKAGKEKIGDKNYLKLVGKLDPDVLPVVLYQSGLPLSADTAKQLGDMTLTLWVDVDTFSPIRLTVDMTEDVNILKDESDKSGTEEGEDAPATDTMINLVYHTVTLECSFAELGDGDKPTVPADATALPAQEFNPYGTDTEEES
jgi:hypothetical protein